MPKVYVHPSFGKTGLEADQTHYLTVVSKESLFGATHEVTAGAVANANGMANTLMVVEAQNGVPWTKPEDLTYGPGVSIQPMLYARGSKGYQILFADGAVRQISSTASDAFFKKIISWSNTEPVIFP